MAMSDAARSEARLSNERSPKSPTFWNIYTRAFILVNFMKLSGTIGVIQTTITFDTHDTFISADR